MPSFTAEKVDAVIRIHNGNGRGQIQVGWSVNDRTGDFVQMCGIPRDKSFKVGWRKDGAYPDEDTHFIDAPAAIAFFHEKSHELKADIDEPVTLESVTARMDDPLILLNNGPGGYCRMTLLSGEEYSLYLCANIMTGDMKVEWSYGSEKGEQRFPKAEAQNACNLYEAHHSAITTRLNQPVAA